MHTAVHELGHLYGLEDVDKIAAGYDQRMSIMSYNTFSDGNGNTYLAVTPMAIDIEAMRQMYNVTPPVDTIADVYDEARFDGSTRMQTIWDNGGDDTIDLSYFTTNSRIDLREALDSSNNFVDARTVVGTEVVYIAKGTVIENAIGGIGNDTIIGNVADNNFTGGGGNDSLEGASGNDTYMFTSANTGTSIVNDDTGTLKIDGFVVGAFPGIASEGELESGIAIEDPDVDGSYMLDDYELHMSGTDLVMDNGTQSITLKNFQDGDYGIHLGAQSLNETDVTVSQQYTGSTNRYVIRRVEATQTVYYQYESDPLAPGSVQLAYADPIENLPGQYSSPVRPDNITGTSGNDRYAFSINAANDNVDVAELATRYIA